MLLSVFYYTSILCIFRITGSEAASIKLNKCTENVQSGNLVDMPSLHIDRFGNISYIVTTHSLVQRNSTFLCPEGKSLSEGQISSVSISEYNSFFLQNALGREFSSTQYWNGTQQQRKPALAQLFLTVVQSNGYLSVGHQGLFADYYSPQEYCIESRSGADTNLAANLKICEISKDNSILYKCCPIGTVLNSLDDACVSTPGQGVWHTDVFDATSLTNIPVNLTYRYKKLPCLFKESWTEDPCNVEFHPLTNNRVIYVGPDRTWKYLAAKEVCFENVLRDDGVIEKTVLFCPVVDIVEIKRWDSNETDYPVEIFEDPNEGVTKITGFSYIYPLSMYIGALFHLLTTLVYMITWRKQNVHGRTLCFCTLALSLMNVFLGNAHTLGILGKGMGTAPCQMNAIFGHYFMISAFTWLLVVNIDLWRTFRTIRAAASQDLRRFWIYSIFGLGFPFVIVAISVILNFTLTCKTSRITIPEYGVHTCFVARRSQGYYVYSVLSVLIAVTCVLAVWTFVKIFIYRKVGNNLPSNKSKEDRQTVVLFLKLGLVMGLSWVFEVISWATTKGNDETNIVWKLVDIYNVLSAVFIFAIFVCKRKTLNLLEETHPALKRILSSMDRMKNRFAGNSSVDTITDMPVIGLIKPQNSPENK